MKNKYIEIWGDVVSQKDLLLSIFLISGLTMGAYFLAPNKPTLELFFGLGGAVLGFTLTSFLIKPKRYIHFNSQKGGKDE